MSRRLMPVSLITVIIAVASVCLLAVGISRGRKWFAAAGIVGVLGTLLVIVTIAASLSSI